MKPARMHAWSGGISSKETPIAWSFRLYATVACVIKETSPCVISSRIRLPRENGSLVKTQQPPSLKSVVRPSSCTPDSKSFAFTVATNGYLAGRFPVEADSNGTSTGNRTLPRIAVAGDKKYGCLLYQSGLFCSALGQVLSKTQQ